ncbi:MAG: hypothetical protein LPJ96_06465 [Exiguobacterium sp.]|uniref:DUF5590 domain-containing protein n=1 Tax=Exiguobacterium alkaliphilum TaxID=1428684 RepID=A0ABT2KV96_9BACL|nr:MULTISPECIES: hypothetical protein [Exiguobacterium]MDX5323235.1 hypothetical protein [Exiguobacterium sp.]KDN57313.1 hypothetical protein DI14_12670 [Exiguobacterium sp. AB2]MCT4793929.1 hypothetical protein [Exiguobacterium alkaliphilum]MDX5425020.1 hypothetical protein [Exiguobacterium sp.]MDX6772451.1 hypothetical protein [Exiguobacterium sp.]
MTRKSKVVIALVTALIGVVIVFSGVYWFTIGHTERVKDAMIGEARERLETEQAGVTVDRATLYNGTEPYVVFENAENVLFVPVDEEQPIVVRDVTNVDLDQICNDSLAETGGTLVSCTYGFDERALVEVVTKANASYTYSYYTLQTGEFIRRVELTDASL